MVSRPRCSSELTRRQRAIRSGPWPFVEGMTYPSIKSRGCTLRALASLRRVVGRGSTGLRPFVVDRNICHFLWYGVVASEGLRSVGADGELPIQERVLYPAPRWPFLGRETLAKLGYPGPWLRGEIRWMLSWALTSWSFLRLLIM